VIAIPNDAVADADAGDAKSDAVREDDAYYSHKRRFTEDSLIPDLTKYTLSRPRALKSCGVGGVRALGARNTIYAVNENRVVDAIILTPRSQARLSERLKQRAHRSRVHHIVHIGRLVSSRLVSSRSSTVKVHSVEMSRRRRARRRSRVEQRAFDGHRTRSETITCGKM
jgi:hypothetical protein